MKNIENEQRAGHGGSWNASTGRCTFERGRDTPGSRANCLGFRVVHRKRMT